MKPKKLVHIKKGTIIPNANPPKSNTLGQDSKASKKQQVHKNQQMNSYATKEEINRIRYVSQRKIERGAIKDQPQPSRHIKLESLNTTVTDSLLEQTNPQVNRQNINSKKAIILDKIPLNSSRVNIAERKDFSQKNSSIQYPSLCYPLRSSSAFSGLNCEEAETLNDHETLNPDSLLGYVKMAFNKYYSGNSLKQSHIEQCCEVICKSPKNYENIINDWLGRFQRQTVIQRFKTDKYFQNYLRQKNLKLIHQLPLSREKINIKKSELHYFDLQQEAWIFKKFSQQIESKELGLIKEAHESGNGSPIIFFKKIYGYLVDFLNRKLNISEFVGLINKYFLSNSQVSHDVKEMFTKITCTDLVSILSVMSEDKPYFGSLLHRVGFPVPLLFHTFKQGGGTVDFYQPQLLQEIFRQKEFQLVINFGSSGACGKGKTTFLNQLYCLHKNKKYFKIGASELHEGSVYVYSCIPKTHHNKPLIIFDFQGHRASQSTAYNSLLKQLITCATIIYYHIHQSDIESMQTYFNPQGDTEIIKELKSTFGKSIVIKRDCKQDEKMEAYHKIPVVCMPKFQQCFQTEFKSKLDQILTIIQEQKFKQGPLNYLKLVNFNDKKLQEVNTNKMIKTMRYLNEHKDTKTIFKTMFPKMYNSGEIIQLQKQISEYQYKSQSKTDDGDIIKKIHNLNRAKASLIEKRTKLEPSEFIKSIMSDLKKDFSMFDTYLDKIMQWKIQATKVIEEQIITKESVLAKVKDKDQSRIKKLKSQIQADQGQLRAFDISIDTVFAEIIQIVKEEKNGFSSIIQRYYDKLLRGMNPINLIEGKTLSFGNQYLETLFQDLSLRSKQKERPIYVISVIGAQSSAKSTLMNYLFKCDFATSAGRCTKGVYFTIVESEERVIVVIDTEGLLSVSARDNIFDVQIASFVMLISDLVIINNKGEVNTTLQNLIGVCLYAIDQLHTSTAEGENETYKPNKVIFTIRDQSDDGSNTQKQMLADIIRHLKQNSTIEYDKYMQFVESDIYPLQSAFMTQSFGQTTVVESNQCFGKAIIALRFQIMQKLKDSKHKSLLSFYINSQSYWKSIVKCGKNIFNFKSILQIQVKKRIQQILDSLIKDFRQIFQKKQQNLFRAFSKNLVEDRDTLISELRYLFQDEKKSLKELFIKECQKVKQIEWVQSFYHSIEAQTKRIHQIYVDKVKDKINQAISNSQKEKFTQIVNEILKKIYTKNISQAEIIQKLQIQGKQLVKYNQDNIKDLQKDLDSLKQSRNLHLIKKQCSNFIIKVFKQCENVGLKFDALLSDKKELLDFTNSKNPNSVKLPQTVKLFGKYNFDFDLLKRDRELSDIFKRFTNQCDKQLQEIIKACDFTLIDGVIPLLICLKTKFDKYYKRLEKQVQSTCSWYNTKFFLKKNEEIFCMFVAPLHVSIGQQMLHNLIKAQQGQIKAKKGIIDDRIKEVKESFDAKGNHEKAAENWLLKMIERLVLNEKSNSVNRIKDCLDNVNINLNPQKLIEKAMNQSIYSKHYCSKDRIVKCFKIISNINRFIRELLHLEPEIKDLQEQISREVKNIIENSKNNTLGLAEKICHDAENHDDSKTVEHYAVRYSIDLSCYKQEDFGQYLDKIFLSMKVKITHDLTRYESKVSEIVRNKIKKQLSNDVEKYLVNKIEPQSIGCQKTCPGCGMKCRKPRGHDDGHQVVQNTHLQECFNKIRYKRTNVRSSSLCYTYQQVHHGIMWVGQQKYPIIEWIQKFHYSWYNHFKKGPYSGNERKSQCEFIWENIGDMLLKYSFRTNNIINEVKPGEYALTEEEMDEYNLKTYYQN